MANRMPIGKFVEGFRAACKREDGYIMGSKGQDPKKWSKTSWWFTQYSGKQKTKALYWRENAARVWDCNGVAEGLYEDFSDVNINTKARYNYANWCDPKGKGMIPVKYRVPGAAVFWGDSASSIHHVAYLDGPVDANNPAGDWYIIEARGVMYGVVRTKLYSRNPNYWGIMSKYFDYENADYTPVEQHLGDRLLKNGCEGTDVKELQVALIRLGFSCGKYGADGDFGDATEQAVEAFQDKFDLVVDGQYGPKSHAVMEKELVKLDIPNDKPKKVMIDGGNCYVRSEPNTSGKKLGVAMDDETYEYAGEVSENGWHKIKYKNTEGWVSGKYSDLVK